MPNARDGDGDGDGVVCERQNPRRPEGMETNDPKTQRHPGGQDTLQAGSVPCPNPDAI